jgi:hypothetical protein
MIKAKIYFLNGFLRMDRSLGKEEYANLRDLNIKVSDYFNENFIELPIAPLVGMGISIESFLSMDMFTEDEEIQFVDLPQYEIAHIQLANGFVYLDVE